jgi:hypothetical protein
MLTVHHTIELQSPQGDIEPTGATVRLPCRRCNGNLTVRKLTIYSPYDENYEWIDCPNCAGTGYLDATVTVTFEPTKFELKTSKI